MSFLLITLVEALRLSVLPSATLSELKDDAHGDPDKRRDVFTRAVKILGAGLINAVGGHFLQGLSFWAALLTAANMSLAIFVLIFDYRINYLLIKNGVLEKPGLHWYTYLRSGGFDAWRPWARLSSDQRAAIRIAYFILSIILYFTWRPLT